MAAIAHRVRPNLPVEWTAHSVGFVAVPSFGVCGPPLTGGVRLVRGALWQRTLSYAVKASQTGRGPTGRVLGLVRSADALEQSTACDQRYTRQARLRAVSCCFSAALLQRLQSFADASLEDPRQRWILDAPPVEKPGQMYWIPRRVSRILPRLPQSRQPPLRSSDPLASDIPGVFP